MPLRVGDRAPKFSSVAHDGQTIEVGGEPLSEVLVLYFYPADETPVCTVQARGFRDELARFTDAGATVVGVSPDDLDSHRRFAEHHGLPFSLLSDADGELRRKFGVKKTLGLMPGRVTFVIDRGGVVQHVFSSQLRGNKHVTEALAVVARLGA